MAQVEQPFRLDPEMAKWVEDTKRDVAGFIKAKKREHAPWLHAITEVFEEDQPPRLARWALGSCAIIAEQGEPVRVAHDQDPDASFQVAVKANERAPGYANYTVDVTPVGDPNKTTAEVAGIYQITQHDSEGQNVSIGKSPLLPASLRGIPPEFAPMSHSEHLELGLVLQGAYNQAAMRHLDESIVMAQASIVQALNTSAA